MYGLGEREYVLWDYLDSNQLPYEQIGVVRQIENGVMSGEISLGNLSVEMLQLSDNKYEVKAIRIKH